MKWTVDHPIFDQLLQLNPWATDLWRRRLELINDNSWNVNAVNQGGNADTRAWLDTFFRVRSKATLEKLRSSADDYDTWAKSVGMIVADLFATREFAKARPGSELVKRAEGVFSVNRAEKMGDYSVGQFKADTLLLSQASLRSAEIHEVLDLSRKTFPVDLDLSGARFLAPMKADGAIFGPFSDHSSVKFLSVDFSHSTFLGQAHFSMSSFQEDATFTNVVFKGPAEFNATGFLGQARFNGSRFETTTGFCGTLFEDRPDFSNAVFQSSTTFEDSIFKSSATFENASFPGRVHVGRIPEEVRQSILDADHP